jgi:hypothetical protein
MWNWNNNSLEKEKKDTFHFNFMNPPTTTTTQYNYKMDNPIVKEIPIKDVVVKEVPIKDVVFKEVPIKDVVFKDAVFKDVVVKDVVVKDVVVKDVVVKDVVVKDVVVKDVVVKDVVFKDTLCKKISTNTKSKSKPCWTTNTTKDINENKNKNKLEVGSTEEEEEDDEDEEEDDEEEEEEEDNDEEERKDKYNYYNNVSDDPFAFMAMDEVGHKDGIESLGLIKPSSITKKGFISSTTKNSTLLKGDKKGDIVMSLVTGEVMTHALPFDIKSIPVPSTVLFVGNTNSGKSTGAKYIISDYGQRHDRVSVFRGSANSDYLYIPPLYDNDEMNEEILDQIYDIQKERTARWKLDPTYDPTLLLILDDLGDDENAIKKNKALKRILQKGRWENISLFVMVQYLKDMPISLRRNFNMIITYQEESPAGRQQFHKEYMACVPVLKQFCTIFDNSVDDFGGFVFCQTKKDKKRHAEKKLFTLRVPSELFEEYEERLGVNITKKTRMKLNFQFQVGSQRYREYNALHYHDKEKERSEKLYKHKLAAFALASLPKNII